MRFNSRQIILIGIALVITSVLFYLGYKTPFAQPKAEGVSAFQKQFSEEAYVTEQIAALPAGTKEKVSPLAQATDKPSLIILVNTWDTINPFVSAHYAQKLAITDPSEATWFAAGTKFYNFASLSNDSSLVQTAVANAQTAFEKVIAINPSNLEAKNALAICIIQGENDVMKGVGLLKEVIEKDSNNVQALYTLGMLSVQSGQMDKAVERFEKLVTIQPFNPENYFYLGEVYAKTGQKEKAIKTYETCKTLLKDKEAKKEIESIISKLKNI